VVTHDLEDHTEELVQAPDHFVRLLVLGQLRRSDYIDKHHRRLAQLAAQLDVRGERPARDILADVAAKQILKALALA
jgi:hypothetical protein